MITWTPEAERAVYTYLNEVSRLAVLRGEDGEELQTSLLEHIRSEVAERGWDIVTEEQARQIIGQLGAPEDVVGESVGSADNRAARPPIAFASAPMPASSQPRQGKRWLSPPGCLINFVITWLLLFFVVPTIGVTAAILLPALSRARIAANESAAIAHMQHIAAAQIHFQTAGIADKNGDGIGDYGTFEELAGYAADQGDMPVIDPALATGAKNGYVYEMTVVYGDDTVAPAFACIAKPQAPGRTGFRCFFVDETGTVRFTTDGTEPNANSPPLN